MVVIVIDRAHGRTAMIDEHIFMVLFVGSGFGSVLAVGFMCGFQRDEGSHLGGFLAGIGFLDLALFFLFAGIGLAPGDLEGLDIVLGTAAGLGLLLGNQRLTVGSGDLVIVGMNFREGQETLPIPAIFDEGGLQRRLTA